MKDNAPDMLVLKLLLAVSVHLLLFSSVNGKIIINHETGLLRKNCSALLHVPLYQNGSERATECPLWFKRDNETNVCTAGPTLDGIIRQDMSTLQTSIMYNAVLLYDGGRWSFYCWCLLVQLLHTVTVLSTTLPCIRAAELHMSTLDEKRWATL